MMRRVLIFIILSLCVTVCGAQVRIAALTKDSCQCSVDSQLVDTAKERVRMEKFFHLRTAQRLHQLDNTLTFVSNESDSVKVAYYKRQILRLFNSDAKVIAKRKDKIDSIGIKDFVDEVASHKILLKSLDSIRVPKWNYELVKGNASDSVFSKSEMRPFRQQLTFGNDESQLAIIKEDTEDGAEWMPLFGDMIVTLKKDKIKKRK